MRLQIVHFFCFISFFQYSQGIFETNKGVRFEIYRGTEADIKSYLENGNLNPIEGIWSFSAEGTIDGEYFKFDNLIRTAIIKDVENNDRDYIQILLSGDREVMNNSGWKNDYIISEFTNTMYANIFLEQIYASAGEIEGAPNSSKWVMEDIGIIKSEVSFWSNGIKFNLYSEGIRILPVYYEVPSSNTESIWKSNGSGFFISTDGYIATNYHVIENASYIDIEFTQNGKLLNFEAEVIEVDKKNDLAILKLKSDSFINFKTIPYIFETKLVDVGTSVFALGYPKALTGMGTEIKFTDGKVSSKTGYDGDVSTYQTSAPTQPGNSGGPLFDYEGNLIGINTSKFVSEQVENVSYSVKSNLLKNLIDILPSKIILPNDESIKSKDLTEKISILSNYVVLIKVR